MIKKVLFLFLIVLLISSCSVNNSIDNNLETTSTKEIDNNKMNTTNDTKKQFPRIDGSTANMPMMAQIRSSYLGESLEEAENNIEVSTTDYAWQNLINNNTDLLLVYEASETTKKIIDESETKLLITPIGVDALVFINNKNNPINDLSKKQIQDIYTGKIRNWSEVGGENINIEAYQRALLSGSQTLFLNLVMKDIKPMEPEIKYAPGSMGGLIDELATYNNTNNAIGYSVYYYAKNMYTNPGLKIMSVDGVEPNNENIANKKYPFTNDYYLVIRANEPEDSPARQLYNYIISNKGREDIIKSGYIPINYEK